MCCVPQDESSRQAISGIKSLFISVTALVFNVFKLNGETKSVGHIYAVLHRNGWRKTMPRSRHPKKASDEAIEASKKLKQK